MNVARPRILITRPEPGASALAEMARAAGFEPVLSPVLGIASASEPPDVAGATALAFTSANGVRAFADAAPAVPSLPVFAVGEATAKAARAAGFLRVLASDGDVRNLAGAIATWAKTEGAAGDVLHIAGRARAGDLVALLAERGVPARRAIVYDAEPAPQLGKAAAEMLGSVHHGDSAAFFSARTARVFIELASAAGLLPALSGLTAACLSPAVAAAAEKARWRRLIVSPQPTATALIGALRREIGDDVLEPGTGRA